MKFDKPAIIFHGENDESVNICEGKEISEWLNSPLQIIKSTQHTFGSAQPWNFDYIPEPLEEVCHQPHLFLKNK